jgi:sugar diacid utilization regulator
MLRLLKRIATTRVGVSPSSDDFAVAAKALRYARIALGARTTTDQKVITFDNSVLGVGAVSAPEVTARLAEVVLTGFDGLPHAARAVLFETSRVWGDTGGSVARTATALVCHQNTLRNGLRRTAECTGAVTGDGARSPLRLDEPLHECQCGLGDFLPAMIDHQ